MPRRALSHGRSYGPCGFGPAGQSAVGQRRSAWPWPRCRYSHTHGLVQRSAGHTGGSNWIRGGDLALGHAIPSDFGVPQGWQPTLLQRRHSHNPLDLVTGRRISRPVISGLSCVRRSGGTLGGAPRTEQSVGSNGGRALRRRCAPPPRQLTAGGRRASAVDPHLPRLGTRSTASTSGAAAPPGERRGGPGGSRRMSWRSCIGCCGCACRSPTSGSATRPPRSCHQAAAGITTAVVTRWLAYDIRLGAGHRVVEVDVGVPWRWRSRCATARRSPRACSPRVGRPERALRGPRRRRVLVYAPVRASSLEVCLDRAEPDEEKRVGRRGP